MQMVANNPKSNNPRGKTYIKRNKKIVVYLNDLERKEIEIQAEKEHTQPSTLLRQVFFRDQRLEG